MNLNCRRRKTSDDAAGQNGCPEVCKNTNSTSNSHATAVCSHAVTLSPALSAVNGLRSEDRGAVDIDVMIKQHREYIDALKYAGADVTELKALAEFPDAQFVEDTALCLPGMAVMMRPGAANPKRRGRPNARCVVWDI